MGILRTTTFSLPALSRRGFVAGAGALAGSLAMGERASAQSPLMWFSASSLDSVDGWTKMYREKAGVKVEYFRAGGVKLAQRFEQEVKAGQAACGPIDISVPALMTKWGRDGLLMEYESPEAKYYPDDTRVPGVWTPIKALDICIAYNADVIKEDEAPRTWADLLDPKWKGKMVMADAFASGATLHWFGAMRKVFGKEYIEKLGKQDVLIRVGSGETTDTMISGERPIAAMILQYYVFDKIKKGANLRVVFPEEGAPVSYEIIGIAKTAPDPEAAKKFVDFTLSKEAQQYWQDTFHTPSMRTDINPLSREYGRRPYSEVKRLASSPKDMDELFADQQAILDDFSRLFK